MQVYYQFKNEEKAGLGLPMPAGIVRVYQNDSKGGTHFVGEDRIGHTPKDEMLNLKIGNAFDVVSERKQVDFEKIASNVYEVEYRDRHPQPQEHAGDGGGQRADRRDVAHHPLHARVHEDRCLGGAVQSAGAGGRRSYAALSRAGHLLRQVRIGNHGIRPALRSRLFSDLCLALNPDS